MVCKNENSFRFPKGYQNYQESTIMEPVSPLASILGTDNSTPLKIRNWSNLESYLITFFNNRLTISNDIDKIVYQVFSKDRTEYPQ